MRDLRIGIVILVCAWLAGCATTAPSTAPGSSTPASVDVTGTWRGSFRSQGVVPVGDVTLVLQQTGNKVTGSVTPPGTAIEGTIEGNRVSYRTISGRGGGDLTVNGDEMTGYSVAGSQLRFKRAAD